MSPPCHCDRAIHHLPQSLSMLVRFRVWQSWRQALSDPVGPKHTGWIGIITCGWSDPISNLVYFLLSVFAGQDCSAKWIWVALKAWQMDWYTCGCVLTLTDTSKDTTIPWTFRLSSSSTALASITIQTCHLTHHECFCILFWWWSWTGTNCSVTQLAGLIQKHYIARCLDRGYACSYPVGMVTPEGSTS